MKRWSPTFALLCALAASPQAASAHVGAPVAPHDLWRSWNANPAILVGMLLLGWLYARGVAELWHRAGRGRGVRRWQVAAFAAGMAALFIALVSPLDALSNALFAAHMAQHLILMLIAAPLLVLGAPLVPLLWALPQPWRRTVVRVFSTPAARAVIRLLTSPGVVVILYAIVLWAWHLPRFYQAALAHEPIHALEHATLLGAALLFWWTLIQPHGRRRLAYGPSLIFVLVTAVHGTALAALITFSDSPWYPAYAATAPMWGLSPRTDQQLAGALMGAPAGTIYLASFLTLVIALLRTSERDALRRERALGDLTGGTSAPVQATHPGGGT